MGSTTADRATTTDCTAATEFVAPVEFTPATEVMEALTTTESAVKVAPEVPIARPVIAATESMEPRTRADENAANEIVGAVKSVRRAGVWVISIVAIQAVGWTDVSRTDSNAYAKPNLSVGGGSCHAGKKYENP